MENNLKRVNKPVLHRVALAGLSLSWLFALAACVGGGNKVAPTQLDLGTSPPVVSAGLTTNPPLAVPAASSASLLNETVVIWRVGNQGQPQAYATYQWVAAPARLVTQKLVDRLSLQGAVLQQNIGGELPQLRLNLQRFEQTFSPQGDSSQAQLTLQVVLIQGSKVLDQLLVDLQVPATTLDAQGGALALRQATDQASEQVAQWVTRVLNKR